MKGTFSVGVAAVKPPAAAADHDDRAAADHDDNEHSPRSEPPRRR